MGTIFATGAIPCLDGAGFTLTVNKWTIPLHLTFARDSKEYTFVNPIYFQHALLLGFDFELWLLGQGVRAPAACAPKGRASGWTISCSPGGTDERLRHCLRGKIRRSLEGREHGQFHTRTRRQ